jgi:phage baseplate assembly protein W
VTRFTDIIGSGWRFPVGIDERRGGIALAYDHDEIEEAIQIILSTPLGYRVMRPEFGSRIHELIFAPINAGMAATVRRYVEEALGYWEPRIELLDIETSADPDRPSCLLITITYRVKASHDERALVYPFYTIPGEEA